MISDSRCRMSVLFPLPVGLWPGRLQGLWPRREEAVPRLQGLRLSKVLLRSKMR